MTYASNRNVLLGAALNARHEMQVAASKRPTVQTLPEDVRADYAAWIEEQFTDAQNDLRLFQCAMVRERHAR